jgi:ribose transport system substrate-binding protein
MLNDVLDRATQANVPVLTIDSDVSYEGRKSCISTQNYSAGAIAARYAAKLIDETGEVAVISHSETAQTALERAGGFEDEMAGTSKQSGIPGMVIPDAQVPVGGLPGNQPAATPESTPQGTPEANPPAPGTPENQPAPTTEAPAANKDVPNDQLGYPNIKIVETKVGGGDVEQSRMAAVQLIKEHPDLKVIYATNQPGTIGACQAIDELGVGNKVQLVGFDYFEGADNYLSSGVLDAVIAQNPYNMGYLGVRYAKKLVTGEAVASSVDTGATLITPDNMNDEDIRFLVNPTGK